MPSNTPDSSRIAADNQNQVLRPNPIMQAPKQATATSMIRPASACSGCRDNQDATATEPSAGAPRRMPSASGPACNTSLMKAGASEIAPPNSTANMSSASAASRIW